MMESKQLLFLLLQFALLVTLCLADCFQNQPTLAERFRWGTSYESNRTIARFTYNNQRGALACGLQVEENGGYVQKNVFPLYTVQEVFQGSDSLVGEEIPIVWVTDTGYNENLPEHLINETEGFLGFIDIIERCFLTADDESSSPYPESNILVRPYSLNECDFWNKPWSQLSEENILFLQASAASTNNTKHSLLLLMLLLVAYCLF